MRSKSLGALIEIQEPGGINCRMEVIQVPTLGNAASSLISEPNVLKWLMGFRSSGLGFRALGFSTKSPKRLKQNTLQLVDSVADGPHVIDQLVHLSPPISSHDGLYTLASTPGLPLNPLHQIVKSTSTHYYFQMRKMMELLVRND